MPRRKIETDSTHLSQFAGNVICPEPPEQSWIPLRLAPYRFQAVASGWSGAGPRPILTPRLLGHREISDFVNAAVTAPDIVKCELDETATRLVLDFESVGYDSARDESYDCVDSMDLVPYEIRKDYPWPDVPVPDFVTKVEAAWLEMEKRFRLAVGQCLCRVFARCGSMHAPHFTAISPAEFALYKILDWKNGIAVSETDEKIYSIHVTKAVLSPYESKLYQDLKSSPRALRAAEYFFTHRPLGFPRARITKELAAAISKHCSLPLLKFDTVKKGQLFAAKLVTASPLLLSMLRIHPIE